MYVRMHVSFLAVGGLQDATSYFPKNYSLRFVSSLGPFLEKVYRFVPKFGTIVGKLPRFVPGFGTKKSNVSFFAGEPTFSAGIASRECGEAPP